MKGGEGARVTTKERKQVGKLIQNEVELGLEVALKNG